MSKTVYVVTIPMETEDPDLPLVARDQLVSDLQGSLLYLFDLGFPYSYPGGAESGRPEPTDPENGQTIYDVTDRENGNYAIALGTVAYAGGGFDLSGVAANGAGVFAPASASADIHTAVGGVVQHPLVFGYFKLPTSGNWVASGVAPLIGSGYDAAAPTLLSLMQSRDGSSNPCIQVRRQKAVGSNQALPFAALAAGTLGSLALIATWRTAANTFVYVRSATERLLVSDISSTDNTADFSAVRMGWGRPNWTTIAGDPYEGVRVYKGGIANLARAPGVDVPTVLDAEWARTQAQITASAAANGGVSQIFN